MSDSIESDAEKLQRYQAALEQFVERLKDDRYVLAMVLVGSLNEKTIWRKESIHGWIIEADGVQRRLRSDGKDERIHRILVENGINFEVEVIPRSRFKQMVEGSSRTAFSCNYFAAREIVYCNDSSISQWFIQANTVAVKDQQRELLAFSTWTIYAVRYARKLLLDQRNLELAYQQILNAAHSVAHTEIIRAGQVYEGLIIDRAVELKPDLFRVIYQDVIAEFNSQSKLQAAIDAIEAYLFENYDEHLQPLLELLRKADRVMPLSEISDHFAFSQVYPWHLEAACEWLERHGHLQKFSAPFKLTKRSLEEVEEPSYFLDP